MLEMPFLAERCNVVQGYGVKPARRRAEEGIPLKPPSSAAAIRAFLAFKNGQVEFSRQRDTEAIVAE